MREHAMENRAIGRGDRTERLRKAAVLGVAIGAAVGVGAAAAIAASSVALARAAATPATRAHTPVELVRVTRADGQSLVWLRGEDVGLRGRYSLIWDEGRGHAQLGDVSGRSGDLIARPVLALNRGELREGVRCRITGWWFPSIEEFAQLSEDVRDVERVEIQLEGGPAAAWVLRPVRRGRPGRGNRWAVHVHGRGALPEETLRGVAPLARAGVTSLVVSYRNDPAAPAGDEGRYGFGITEARDVDAAIAYAFAQGASRVTLVGWSMGATACLVAATRGAHKNSIDGLILDSPAVDWPGILQHQAGMRRAPGFLASIGVALLEHGVVATDLPEGIDFSTANAETFARELRVPVLVHASRRDTFVPSEGAERLARLNPTLVQLRLVDRGEHVKLWNVNQNQWEESTETFARALPRPAWRGE